MPSFSKSCSFVLPVIKGRSGFKFHARPYISPRATMALVSDSHRITSAIPMLTSNFQISTPLLTAGISLVVSSLFGMLLESKTKLGRALGASLIAFLSQSLLSNINLIPMESPIYDACWGKVLPASLSLSVLLAVAAAGTPTSSSRTTQDQLISLNNISSIKSAASSSLTSVPQRNQKWAESSLWKVLLANVFGACGAVIGGLLAFTCASRFQDQFPKPVLAKIVASIATTHIGGSINFFQVARSVGLDREGQGLLGAVAGADIFLMALHFAALFGIQRNPTGTAAFIYRSDTDQTSLKVSVAAFTPSSSISSNETRQCREATETRPLALHARNASPHTTLKPAVSDTLLPAIFALLLALMVGEGGQFVERELGVPGAAAGAITALSAGVYGLIRRLAPRCFLRLALPVGAMSSFLFSLFFAAIGAGASLMHLAESGPVIVTLMSVSLLVHLLTTMLGIRVYNRFVPWPARISVDEAVIASNANVGGPATAAAMAGSMGRADLVLSAAATGTAGYAVATFIGVALFKFLAK